VSRAPKDPSDGPKEPAPTPAAAPEEPKGGKKERPGKGGKDGPAGGKPKGGKAGSSGAPTKKAARVAPDNPNFRYIVRMAGSDLDGLRPTGLALTGVHGVGRRVAELACRMAQVNPAEMIGNLPEPTVEGMEALLNELPTRAPTWMLNHRIDRTTGEVHHYFGADIDTARRDDINAMKMIRSYRGVRHERGQKVRGQRTRSNGRTGMAAGVLKKEAKAAAEAKGKEGGAAAPAAPAAAAPAAEKKA